ncbi:MAG: DUF4625 domain-containing protein [Bacteroidota bacterium]|nr:DUF4625 domain-containing protein [Bacteroidota bacterium]
MKTSFRLFILILVLFYGCTIKKEDPKPVDTSKPKIELTSTTPSFQSNGSEFKISANAGDLINLNLKYTDDNSLKQSKIDIHDAFDGHSHGRKELNKWTFSNIMNLSGSTQSLTSVITVPSDIVAGAYHLIINCIDASGNEADFVEIDLSITNIIEQASISGINVIDTNITSGQMITVSGIRITDNQNLEGGTVEVHFESADEKIAIVENIGSNVLKGKKDLVLDPITFKVPDNAPKGKYYIHVKVKDSDGNMSELETELILN